MFIFAGCLFARRDRPERRQTSDPILREQLPANPHRRSIPGRTQPRRLLPVQVNIRR